MKGTGCYEQPVLFGFSKYYQVVILIWQERIVSSAASCLAGVTPAQQEASQEIGVSGSAALR